MSQKLDEIRRFVKKVKADCKQLRKKGQLTERGKGQIDIILLIEKILNE